MKHIEPCPHCKPELSRVELRDIYTSGGVTALKRVTCSTCHCAGPAHATESKAVGKWNNVAHSIRILRSRKSYKWAQKKQQAKVNNETERTKKD